jgi:hypothetical protein
MFGFAAGPSPHSLEPNGTDSFQYKFYEAVAADPTIPLDWVGISHYGAQGFGNFPGADVVQRTAAGSQLEMQAMRTLAQRPRATLDLMEWTVLQKGSNSEWSPLGSAWMATSTAAWVCNGVDRTFHWFDGLTGLVNRSGDGRKVLFFEQHHWNMALLELFIGGAARFATYDLPQKKRRGTAPASAASGGNLLNSTIGVIESVKADSYYALVAALGHDRGYEFRTTVALRAPFEVGSVQQYRMNSSVSVLETLIRELKGQPGMLQTDDGLPVPFAQLLTPAGFKYAEAPENLDRLWRMHADTFKPSPFDGTWTPSADAASTEIEVGVTAPEVTVIVAHKKQS